MEWTQKKKGALIIGVIFILFFLFLVITATVFLIIWGTFGIVAHNDMFKADPSQGPAWGCVIDRTIENPSNLGSLQPECNYPNATTFWNTLSLPLANWSYVNFTSRLDNETDAVDPLLNLKGILMISDTARNPFIIVSHGIRCCKECANVLIPGAMLWRNGFNVLLLDLRNHGQSQTSAKYKYATFGLQEFRDILGALDFLLSTYPRLQNTTDQVGMMGVSMGGAVTELAWALNTQKIINCLFLDAPALVVRETLIANIKSAGYDADFIFNAATARASYIWPWSMPPFKYDPMAQVSDITSGQNTTRRHAFFTQKNEDKMVPLFNSLQGIAAMQAIGVNVTSYFATDPNAKSYCSNHVDMFAFDPQGYERRMVGFFNDHLSRL